MTLDLSAIATQIQAMAASVDGVQDAARFAALGAAWRDLDSVELNRRLTDAKTTFRVPAAGSNVRATAPLPLPLTDYSVVATDASFILPNRHHPARFWLLNLGIVVLRYGAQPSAELWSTPELHYEEHELVVPDDIHHIPINGANLSPKRAAAELAAAVGALDHATAPAVALQDGTLILYELDTPSKAVIDWVLPDFLAAFRRARDRGTPVASYISSPGAGELVNALRVSICDYPTHGRTVDCQDCRGRIASEGRVPVCDILPPVTDQWLLREVAELQPGQRTTTYGSTLNVLERYRAEDPDFHIHYFYMHNGWEIGRVEVPRWVAEDLNQLDLVHWVLHDQSRLGLGYPLALQEAHELAVLSMADRRLVEDAIERALADANVTVTYHGKAGSKRVRAI